jgi:hypothetical protein
MEEETEVSLEEVVVVGLMEAEVEEAVFPASI